MWSSVPYLCLLFIMILLVLSISAVTTMGAPVGEPEDTNGQQDANDEAEGDSKSRNENDSSSSRNTSPCWETENYTVLGPCTSCQPFVSKVFSESCEETGFNQLVICLKSDQKVYKSCPRSRENIENSFWVFEGVMFVIGLVSSLVVFCRRRKLNREAAERVRKQISNSV